MHKIVFFAYIIPGLALSLTNEFRRFVILFNLLVTDLNDESWKGWTGVFPSLLRVHIVLLLYFRSLYPHPWICHVLAIPCQIYQVFKFKVYLSSLDYLSWSNRDKSASNGHILYSTVHCTGTEKTVQRNLLYCTVNEQNS